MKALPPSVMSGTTHRMTHCHIPEELNLKQGDCAKSVFFIWSEGNI